VSVSLFFMVAKNFYFFYLTRFGKFIISGLPFGDNRRVCSLKTE
jgi:hypothetical protein